jgi:effector-binding domain-containing protein
MNIQIFNHNLQLTIYGFSGTAANKDYATKAFHLMDKMWQVVKSNGIKNKGRNIWVYEPDDNIFAGVELEQVPSESIALEKKDISLSKYASYRHIGPYNLIKQSGQHMINELNKKGLSIRDPYIEIYGHWTNDETKLETELVMCLK